jgi:hypothetical protein
MGRDCRGSQDAPGRTGNFRRVGLNALANVAAIYLISGWQPPRWQRPCTDQFRGAVLPPISVDFRVGLLALVIVAVSMIVVVLALQRLAGAYS